MIDSTLWNILGLVLQIAGILVIGFSVKRTRPQTSSTSIGDSSSMVDQKTGLPVNSFTLPRPKATWGGILIIIAGLGFQILAEIRR